MKENTVSHDFFNWLSDGINDGSVIVNNHDAAVFVVEEGLLCVSPLIFKLFCKLNKIKGLSFIDVMKEVIDEKVFLKSKNGNFNTIYDVKGGSSKVKILNGVVLHNTNSLMLNYPLPDNFECLKRSVQHA